MPKISTHAPRTGSDGKVCADSARYGYFNPRSPHGERLSGTCRFTSHHRDFNPRSPHGERRHLLSAWRSTLRFQPTLPARGATTTSMSDISLSLISTHAPRTGSDISPCAVNPRWKISTHAPRTGSDRVGRCRRSPDGGFQPTLPARGATGLRCRTQSWRRFQPTLPARGATRQRVRRLQRQRLISTHAPRTGSDRCNVDDHLIVYIFQPTLPARGATFLLLRRCVLSAISTHAPRTGSDMRPERRIT